MEINRFIEVQGYWMDIVESELKNGKKVSHWIWFIFPQLRGLGKSSTSDYYGLDSLEDAREYYANKYLKKNLDKCLHIIYKYKDIRAIKDCLGELDTMKLHSCVTLFYLAVGKKIFKQILDKFFNSLIDKETVILLEKR